MSKKRYAIVGTGGRSRMFHKAITQTYPQRCELVAVCDPNPGRAELSAAEAREHGQNPAVYAAADFDRMVAEAQPDTVIVTTMDCIHDEYICRAMQLGCDVITEKPMTTDAEKCQRILDTQKATGRRVTVTFNYRYAPPRTQCKDLLMSGVIGDIKAVDFNYRLSVDHGADYFRRWHRNKANSGSLLVHKATHHFDLVNWWISDVPQLVWAQAKRDFYAPQMARRYGMEDFGPRCQQCADHEKCPWYLDLSSSEGLRELYLEQEQHDGYFRDRCIFLPENGKAFEQGVDIDDYMSVSVRYRGGAMLTYSLVTYHPHEGYTIVFHGTKGRLTHAEHEASYINGDGSVPGELIEGGTYIEVDEHHGDSPAWRPDVWTGKGGHGGADPVMLSCIFGEEDPAADKYMRASDHRAGAYSILTGVAASRSILTGEAVRIDDLVSGLETPPMPAMPSDDEPLTKPQSAETASTS